MKRICHISDLHITSQTTSDEISRVVEVINEFQPNAIICTGDLTSRSTKNTMESMYVKLLNFRNAIECKDFLSVPGNHDLYDEDFNEIDLYARFWSDEETFVKNLDGAFLVGINSGRQKEDSTAITNVSAKIRQSLDAASAYIRRGDVREEEVRFISEIIRASSLNDVRILAVHHHLFPIYNYTYKTNYNFDMVMNAADILETLRLHRFDIVLNGHKHTVQINTFNDIIHFTGGSLFAPLPIGQENSISLIDIDDSLHFQVHFLQSKKTKTLRHIPNPKYFAAF